MYLTNKSVLVCPGYYNKIIGVGLLNRLSGCLLFIVSLECLRDVYRKMPWRQLSRRLRKGFRLMYSWVGELTPGRGERREEDFHENLWNANMWGLRRENGAHTGIWEETARSAGTKKNEHMTSRNARAETISWRCEWSTGWNLQRGKEN